MKPHEIKIGKTCICDILWRLGRALCEMRPPYTPWERENGITRSVHKLDAQVVVAEFLAILEERGVQLTPKRCTEAMIDAALDHPDAFYDDRRCQSGEPGHGWPGTLYREMLAAAPSLAELLAEPPCAPRGSGR